MKHPSAEQSAAVYRHTLLVRITHWINAACFLFLVPSGIAILIAHPEFYWGQTGYFGAPAAFSLPLEPNFNHTGWGRGMHFFFAWILVLNGLVYVVSGILSRRQRRKLLPGREQLRWHRMVDELRAHLRFRPPRGDAGRQYNLLQKLSYLIVVLLLFPLMLISGLAMSPAIVAAFPELLDMFGGRQSARTIHFIAAGMLVLFLLIHLLEVFLVGVVEEVRSMITGRWVVESTREKGNR